MGIVNKAFIGMDVANGAGKIKNTFKNSVNNKYDNIMNTSKSHLMQPKPSSVQASELIDDLFLEKTAFAKANKVKKFKDVLVKHVKDMPNKIDKLDKYNNQALKDFKRAVKGKKFKKALKHGANASKVTIPAIAAGAGTAYGAGKAVKHFEDKKKVEERSDLLPKAVTGAVGGALAFNAIANKSALHPLKLTAKAVNKSFSKIPKEAVRRTGKMGNMAVDVYDNAKNQIKNHFSKLDKQEAKRKAERNARKAAAQAEAKKRRQKNSQNKTSFEIDIMYELEKTAKYEFAKKVFKENFLRAGVESIPYNLAPAVASVALGRDLKRGGAKMAPYSQLETTVIDIPNNRLGDITNKKAAMSEGAKRLIERSAEGLGRAVFPAATSLVIGKNIMNNMQDMKKEDKISTLPPVQEGATRIIVQKDMSNKKKL